MLHAVCSPGVGIHYLIFFLIFYFGGRGGFTMISQLNKTVFMMPTRLHFKVHQNAENDKKL